MNAASKEDLASHSRTEPHHRTSIGTLIRQRTLANLMPDKKIGKAPGVWQSIKAILLASWLNLLLFCIPVSWVLHFALPHSLSSRDTIIFVFSFLAIVPLAKLLAFATEEISLRVGQTLAGLINATLGNAVELIVAIIALVKCELRIVQASLVGSILSNLLLVLGMCFFAGGLKYSEQGFGASATQLNSSLLTISVIAVLLPAAFHFAADPQLSNNQEGHDILAVSRGVAIILLFIYAAYLSFQLYSHTALYSDHATGTTQYDSPKFRVPEQFRYRRNHKVNGDVENSNGTASTAIASHGAPSPAALSHRTTSIPSDGQALSDQAIPQQDGAHSTNHPEGEEEPNLSLPVTLGLLVVITVLVAITAEWLVDSIDGMTSSNTIGKEFVGIILLPIVGNAAEHVTAVAVSVKDKLNLSLGVAVGSSIQIALFVIPFIVTLAWILGKPLTLLFDPYESVALFLAVLTVNYVVQDGKSNWLEGFILMCLYLILAVTFWFYPGSDPSGVLATCH
ncbi:calcium/proton exchanger [Agrocybe pediades]|nr:calcium/proton exchanger [Agrocybe pediades]